MYPAYIEVAKFQKEKKVHKEVLNGPGVLKKMHKMIYEKALESVNSGKDPELGPIQVCEVCGYTLEGDAPDVCPICGALKEKFTAFE